MNSHIDSNEICLKRIKILLISNSFIMLSIDIVQWRNVFPGKRVTLPSTSSERLYERKIDPLAHAKKWLWAGQQKRLYVEMLARVGGNPAITKGSDPATWRAILLAKPTLCFSCKRLATFCKGNVEKRWLT